MLVMKPMRIFAYSRFDLVEAYDYMVMHQIYVIAHPLMREGGVEECMDPSFQKKHLAMLSLRCVQLRICHVLRQSGGGWKICPKDFGNIRFLDFQHFPAFPDLNWTLKGRKENRLKLWPPSKFMTFQNVFHSIFKQLCPKPTNFWNRSEILI